VVSRVAAVIWFCPPDLAHFDHLIWPTPCRLLLIAAGPVGTVRNASRRFASRCGNPVFRISISTSVSIRPPHFFLFDSFSFFVEKISLHDAL
jgi:hypothetical protein